MIDPDFSSALFCICIAVINITVFQISFHYHAPFFIFDSAQATVFLRIDAIKELSDKRAHQKGLKGHCKTMQIRVFSELEWWEINWNAKWKCARVKCNCTQTWAGNEEWSTAKHTEAQLCLLNEKVCFKIVQNTVKHSCACWMRRVINAHWKCRTQLHTTPTTPAPQLSASTSHLKKMLQFNLDIKERLIMTELNHFKKKKIVSASGKLLAPNRLFFKYCSNSLWPPQPPPVLVFNNHVAYFF